jgi:hypothetical protein
MKFNQVEHLVKMANVIIVKWGILLTYLPYSTAFLPTYLSTYWPTYLPTYLFTYLLQLIPTNQPTCLLITTYLPIYFCIYLPTTTH